MSAMTAITAILLPFSVSPFLRGECLVPMSAMSRDHGDLGDSPSIPCFPHQNN